MVESKACEKAGNLELPTVVELVEKMASMMAESMGM